MKQIFACVAFFLICIGSTLAQFVSMNVSGKVAISEGDVFETKNTLFRILGKGIEKTYVLQGISTPMTEKYTVARYGADMSFEQETALELKIDGKPVEYRNLVYAKGSLLLFTMHYDQQLGKKYLFCEKLDLNTLQVTGKAMELAEIDVENKKVSRYRGFRLYFSPDSTKIAVEYGKTKNNSGNYTFGIHIFDADVNKIWSTDLTIPYANDDFYATSVEISDIGNVMVGGYLLNNTTEQEKKYSSDNYAVFEFTDEGNKRSEYSIDLEGKYVHSIIIDKNKSGELVCGGFFTDDEDEIALGSYFVRFDRATGQVIQKSVKEFDSSFIVDEVRQFEFKKNTQKGPKVGVSKLYLNHLIHKADGGVILVGEQYFVVETNTTNSTTGRSSATGQASTRSGYNYNDIILAGISPKGEINWNTKIPKRQMVSAPSIRYPPGLDYLSYGYMISDSNLYLFYNENPENLENTGKNIQNLSFRNPLPVIVKVDDEGRTYKNRLFSETKEKVIVQPGVSLQTNTTEMMISLERGKKKSFMMVKVKD